jgi:hypothetical protein
MTVEQRLAALCDKPLKGWEINFLKSFRGAISLTENQLATLEKIEKRFSAGGKQKELADWVASWDNDKRNRFVFACKYLRSHNVPRKYRVKYTAITSYLHDPIAYIPDEKSYRTIVENSYVVKVYNAYCADAKYSIGDMVYVNKSQYTTKKAKPSDKEFHWSGIITEVREINLSHGFGRDYVVEPITAVPYDMPPYVIKEYCMRRFVAGG